MPLPTISLDAVASVLDLAPQVDTLTAIAGPIGSHPDLHAILAALDDTGFIAPVRATLQRGVEPYDDEQTGTRHMATAPPRLLHQSNSTACR